MSSTYKAIIADLYLEGHFFDPSMLIIAAAVLIYAENEQNEEAKKILMDTSQSTCLIVLKALKARDLLTENDFESLSDDHLFVATDITPKPSSTIPPEDDTFEDETVITKPIF